MAPTSVLEPPPHVGEKASPPASPKKPNGRPVVYVTPPAQERLWLNESLLENSPTRPKKRVWVYALSVAVQVTFVVILVLVPLFFTDVLDLRAFTKTLLVAPPPPPPPPPAPATVAQQTMRRPMQRVFQVAGKLIAPVAIPEKVAMLKERPEDLMPDVGAGFGVPGGVPGGMPGGQIGGVLGGIITNTPRPAAPGSAGPSRVPLRIGGNLMAPKLIIAPDPSYPPLAKQARIQGDVHIDAVIDVNGNVVEMQLVKGHPMLVNAAMDALRKWKYQPTILNGEPVPVQLIVVIKFRMS
jgi:protein TonB